MVISGIKMPVSHSLAELEKVISKKCDFKPYKFKIVKKSVDARRGDVKFVYSVEVIKNGETFNCDDKIDIPFVGDISRPLIVGFGPAGMFCAYILAKAGMKPIVFERGADADQREKSVKGFKLGGKLDTNTNIQFGEGGAGTFSDGKLTTQISNPLCSEVLRIFAEFGAPDEILYLQKPHIGTDILINVIKNIRKEILRLGGEIHFNEAISDISVVNGKIAKINGNKDYYADNVVFAIGHSARDTFKLLYEKGANMIQKPFSVGVRIEHQQEMINKAQYGDFANSPYLGAADYKLSTHLPNGRGVYTFCMCPGGEVVAATSEEEGVVTNGMSYHKRDGKNANSAVLVSVLPDDFKNEHPLAGVEFQREIERMAYTVKNDGYKAPVQMFGDFKKSLQSSSFGNVLPTYEPGVKFVDLNKVLPEFVSYSLKSGIEEFGRKIKGFDAYDALLTGPETRSSSPLRIVRNESMQSNIEGLYPIGEGAGYAGGITSSAVDGMKCALKIIEKYSK